MNNDDLAVALQRMGCVVVRPHHRGAWGSEGYYTFTHCIEDAVVTADWAVGEQAAKYGIDPARVFLAGQSAGGQTALNAARQLPWVLGTILMAPFNVAVAFRNGLEAQFNETVKTIGYVLRQETPNSIFEDAKAACRSTDFVVAFDELKDRNLYFTGGTLDAEAPVAEMIMPLWEKLRAHGTQANQKLELYDTNHGFCDRRVELARGIGEWITEVCETVSL
jgi:acetyl esterase/lipase